MLLTDGEVAALLRYPDASAFRRQRRKLEEAGFPKRRPVIRRYSQREIEAWIDGQGQSAAPSPPDPLGDLAGAWGKSP